MSDATTAASGRRAASWETGASSACPVTIASISPSRRRGDGATYVAFGSFFASPTKPHAVAAPIGLLSAARAKLDVPIAAIGGITARNGAALIEAGASYLAAIGGVFGEDDAEHAARGYAALFS